MSIQRGNYNIDGQRLLVYKAEQSLTINCVVVENSASLNISLTWKFNNSMPVFLSGPQPGTYQVNEKGIQQLHITKLTGSDDGVYSCHALICKTTVFSKSFTLNFNVDCVWSAWSACSGNCHHVGTRSRVKTLKQYDEKDCTGPSKRFCGLKPCMPRIHGTTVSVDEGRVVTLTCDVTHASPSDDSITFEWFKMEKGSSPVHVAISRPSRVSKSQLRFQNANQNDTGNYTCKAMNDYGTSDLSSASRIIVNCGPELVTIHLSQAVGVKGRAFTFSCSAVGYPMPSYVWILPDGQSYTGKTLILPHVQFENGGIYRCKARIRNNAGLREASASVKFHVEGPPENCDQPLASSYEALTIIVNVTYPFDGNSVITEYELQYRILPEQWASVKYNASVSQPFIIKNLIPFTLYEVQVQAVNKYAYENNNTSFSNPVRVRTARAAPLKLRPPHLFSAKTSVQTMLFVAPYVDDQNGPISYVDFIVHVTTPGSPASTIPPLTDSFAKDNTWYIAAQFTFDEYKETLRGKNFILGSGTKTVDRMDTVYTNQPLVQGRKYYVYCKATGTDISGRFKNNK
jgi:hypothetical protein